MGANDAEGASGRIRRIYAASDSDLLGVSLASLSNRKQERGALE